MAELLYDVLILLNSVNKNSRNVLLYLIKAEKEKYLSNYTIWMKLQQ